MDQKLLKVREFCARNGLVCTTKKLDNDEVYISVGLSGFNLNHADDLQHLLAHCLEVHKTLSNIKWESGVLDTIFDSVTTAAIEDEIAASFDQDVLDKLAGIFAKHKPVAPDKTALRLQSFSPHMPDMHISRDGHASS